MVKAIFPLGAVAVMGLLMMGVVALNASEQESNTTKVISESDQTQVISDKPEEKKD